MRDRNPERPTATMPDVEGLGEEDNVSSVERRPLENQARTSEKSSKARQYLSFGQLELAQALAEEILAENDKSADAHSLIASILDRRGEWQSSLAHLRRAYKLMPGGPQVRLNLAMALLRIGDYREGLALYEARLDKPTWSGFATAESRATNRDRLLRPGDNVDGRRILLLAEQGLGDGIMSARYIPLLAKRGARIAVASNPTLRPFFARLPGIETLLSPPPDQPFAQINLAALPFDAWLPLLSLPNWFRTDLQSVPSEFPYWNVDQSLVAHWHSRFAVAGRSGKPKVGLVFQANRSSAGFADRSMRIVDLAPLLKLDSLDIVNLQFGPPGRELVAAAPHIIDPMHAEVPLDEYGAMIAATDLLITVDTMAVHLSGALGHATWVAVPHSPQWTWGLTGTATPWYAATRIFRQHKDREWSGAVAAVAENLQERFGPSLREIPHISSTSRGEDRTLASGAERLDLALSQLRRGQLEQGFANYEARMSIPLWSEQALPLQESLIAVRDRQLRPGDEVRGRRVAVFTEQGLGDTFLGARFLVRLAEQGAKITLICRAPMRPFFARLSFLDTILSPPDDAPHAKIDLRKLSFDAFCPLLSLPYALGISAEAALSRGPYLMADPTQVAVWRERYERHGRPGHRKVGLVWQANPTNSALSNRSMRTEDLAPLAQLETADLVNLQHGAAGRDLARIAPKLMDATQVPLTLDEFAAALAATDLVVSVDTMAAHCAGSLGHPVFVALPAEPGWWWGLDRADCDWYPSARLFRLCFGDDWAATVATIITALRNA
jgi:ADP-heptose:LPS heptosyltransferase